MTLSRSLYRSFGVLLALLLLLTGFSLFNFRRLSDADAWKVHTFQVLESMHRAQDDLEKMDSGVRGFIVEKTPDTTSLYNASRLKSETELQKLGQLTQDQPDHQHNLKRLQSIRQVWIDDHLEPILAMRRRVTDDALALQNSGKAAPGRRRTLMAMTGILDEMKTKEENLLVQRSQEQKRWQELTQVTLWVGSFFSMVLATVLALLVTGASKRLDVANASLVHINTQLEGANEQLADSNSQLNAEVAQRRAAEAKLLKTVNELERSNAELEQFAYVASHDLQEPLRAVAGCVQVLKKRYSGQLDARADQFIEHAVDGAQRMQNLINDLLSYSRLGTRGKPFEPVNMEKVLARVQQNISEAIQETGAQVTHDALPTLVGDSGQLEQVLQNLLSNAVKFRGNDAPHAHVIYRHEDDTHIFGVRDNGLGIEPQYFERIFIMFQRLHTRAEYPGTGIGLAICKKIAERHHGKIWVESTPGQGATFWFSISAQLGQEPDGPVENSNESAGAESISSQGAHHSVTV